MNKKEFIKFIQNIVEESCNLKNSSIDQKDALVNYACIFCQSDEEYNEFVSLANQLGEAIKETPTGPLFHIQDLETISGKLRLLKVRKPDKTRKERGDADFTIADYDSFKGKYLSKQGFSLIKRENFEMIELINSNFNVRTYFSNPPLDKQLGL